MTDSSLMIQPHSKKYTVSDIIVHPGNSVYTITGDVAMVYIAETIPFTDYIQPICLPDVESKMADFVDCYHTGWGRLHGQGSSKFKMC